MDEGALRYKAKSGEAEYYVFEGRYQTDGVYSEDDRDKNIKLEEEE